MTIIVQERESLGRLGQLGLSYEQLRRPLLRADAEAALVSGLEPPTAEGITRYNKTTRFLREELLPHGWTFSNASNFCRTVHPSGHFSIVTSSGSAGVGLVIPGQTPSTKYPKGETTTRAVAANVQLTFDLGQQFTTDEAAQQDEPVWYLLYQVTSETIFCELSFPNAVTDGFIVGWFERIVLPPLDRAGIGGGSQQVDYDDDAYDVEVELR